MSKLTDLIFSRGCAALKAALQTWASPNEQDERGRRALSLAAACGYSDAVRTLVEAGADVNAANADKLAYTPLIEAAREGKADAVRTLLDLGADVEGHDSRKGTALLGATISAQDEVVRLLIERGARVDTADVEGQTPLHYLCRFARGWGSGVITRKENGVTTTLPNPRFEQHTKVFNTLLEKGADPKRMTDFGYSALHLAGDSDAHEFVAPLVRAGADVNAANSKGYCALHAASDRGNVRAIEALIAAGANLEAADDLGFTPLFGAVLSGGAPAVKLLLAHGASSAAKATGGFDIVAPGDTPADVARKKGAAELVALLGGKKRAPGANRKPAAKKQRAKMETSRPESRRSRPKPRGR